MHYMHTNIVCVATAAAQASVWSYISSGSEQSTHNMLALLTTATDTDTDTDTTDTDTANYQTITLNLFCNAIFSLHYFLLPYTATFFLLWTLSASKFYHLFTYSHLFYSHCHNWYAVCAGWYGGGQ